MSGTQERQKLEPFFIEPLEFDGIVFKEVPEPDDLLQIAQLHQQGFFYSDHSIEEWGEDEYGAYRKLTRDGKTVIERFKE